MFVQFRFFSVLCLVLFVKGCVTVPSLVADEAAVQDMIKKYEQYCLPAFAREKRITAAIKAKIKKNAELGEHYTNKGIKLALNDYKARLAIARRMIPKSKDTSNSLPRRHTSALVAVRACRADERQLEKIKTFYSIENMEI